MRKFQEGNSIPGRNLQHLQHLQVGEGPRNSQLCLQFQGLREGERNQKGKCVGSVFFSYFNEIIVRTVVSVGNDCALFLALLYKDDLFHNTCLFFLCHCQTSKPLVVIIASSAIVTRSFCVECWVLAQDRANMVGHNFPGHTLEPQEKVLVWACRGRRNKSSCSDLSGLVTAPLCLSPHYVLWFQVLSHRRMAEYLHGAHCKSSSVLRGEWASMHDLEHTSILNPHPNH